MSGQLSTGLQVTRDQCHASAHVLSAVFSISCMIPLWQTASGTNFQMMLLVAVLYFFYIYLFNYFTCGFLYHREVWGVWCCPAYTFLVCFYLSRNLF